MPPKKRLSQSKAAVEKRKGLCLFYTHMPAWISLSQRSHVPHTLALACRIVLAQRDITNLTVDAIVNAANEKLQRGGGVCGSIFQAAGPRMDTACATISGCATGEAVLTEAFDIHNIKAIIHAVGPRVNGPLTEEHRQQLASSYRSSLDVCVQHGLTSIVCYFFFKGDGCAL